MMVEDGNLEILKLHININENSQGEVMQLQYKGEV